ncbi:sulfotransferase family protein [Williamsia sp.]|uniref:sulfotransferase family protein n=1 Tax=Williamsia sp. TaxID=1872085 RepID=UPI001A27F6D6|nr:sulfotransferase family protein [Williamsia sp.]MBJ7288111.1 sulfotransferase family protein [Williamsia sp.]
MVAARPRIFVHVGLPKTGTTYLQDRLWRNRDIAMRTSGLLYPGTAMQDHFHAAVHLQPDRYLDWVDPAHSGVWRALVDQMRTWPGTSVISHELFSTATEDQAASVIADLDFADVHVVVTVRDLARQIPSVWQENVKNQHRSTLDGFVDSLRTRPLDEQEPFWEFQDHGRILRTWGAGLPPGNVHLVTVPRAGGGSDPTSLWDRFVGLLDADGDALDRPVPPSNAALSPAQVELLRRLNEHLQPERVEWARYETAVKRFLIGSVLFGSPGRAGRSLSPDQTEWAAAQSDSMIADIEASGWDVVGDIEDLRVTRVAGGRTGEPTTDETLDVAVSALAEVLATMPLPTDRPRVTTRAKAVIRGAARPLLRVRAARRARRRP